jgi:predicted nucleotidyltransferase component of viral defense system
MIERNRLREFHRQDLPLHILEQDYIQALFLVELYDRVDHLVFKGGTYLKHAHGLDRFSEDLDFTLNGEEDVRGKMEDAADALSYYGVPSEVRDPGETETGLNLQLVYEGPLYDGTGRSKGRIDIEVSKRDGVFLSPEWTRLFFDYPEMGAVTCLGMKLEETMAEKLRALATRSQARDLYDVWFLLNKDVEPDIDLFERKMSVVGEDAVVRITVTEDDWNRDLAVFVEHPPTFADTLDRVVEELEQASFTVEQG